MKTLREQAERVYRIVRLRTGPDCTDSYDDYHKITLNLIEAVFVEIVQNIKEQK